MKTYQNICEIIAEEFNSSQNTYKISWESIWNAPSIKRFPAIYLDKMLIAIENGNLIDLMISDSTIAKIFIKEILNETI